MLLQVVWVLKSPEPVSSSAVVTCVVLLKPNARPTSFEERSWPFCNGMVGDLLVDDKRAFKLDERKPVKKNKCGITPCLISFANDALTFDQNQEHRRTKFA